MLLCKYRKIIITMFHNEHIRNNYCSVQHDTQGDASYLYLGVVSVHFLLIVIVETRYQCQVVVSFHYIRLEYRTRTGSTTCSRYIFQGKYPRRDIHVTWWHTACIWNRSRIFGAPQYSYVYGGVRGTRNLIPHLLFCQFYYLIWYVHSYEI